MPRPAPASATADMPCPCGLARPYRTCCGRYHAGPDGVGISPAPDAEALMRSRYSAHVLGLGDVLLVTWHPSTRPGSPPEFPPGLRWLGLEVRAHQVQDADHATVEFVARNKLGGRAERLHEVSRFVREGGRWYYLEGELR